MEVPRQLSVLCGAVVVVTSLGGDAAAKSASTRVYGGSPHIRCKLPRNWTCNTSGANF